VIPTKSTSNISKEMSLRVFFGLDPFILESRMFLLKDGRTWKKAVHVVKNCVAEEGTDQKKSFDSHAMRSAWKMKRCVNTLNDFLVHICETHPRTLSNVS